MRALPLLCLWLAAGRAAPAPGWLDRVVQYRKANFIRDVQDTLPAIEMHARIEAAPPGFEDSKEWDFDSVMRLLKMLRQSQTGRRVHRALRRMMMSRPNRRIYLSYLDSYKYFPSIHKDNYYEDTDMESVELLFETTPHAKILNDNDVIIVSNPVEARLPSTKISVKMLRAILEERAFAARIMPPTTKREIEWLPMENSTGSAGKSTTGGANATAGGDGQDPANITTAAGADVTTAAGADVTTAAGADVTTAAGNTEKAETTPDPNAETPEKSTVTEKAETEKAETEKAETEKATDPAEFRRHVKKVTNAVRTGGTKEKHHKDGHHRQQRNKKYKPSMRKHGQGLRSMGHSMPQTRPKLQPWFKNY